MSSEGIVFKPEDFKVKPTTQPKPKWARVQERLSVASGAFGSTSKTTKGKEKPKAGTGDPLAEFYAEAKAQTEREGRAGVRP